MQKWGIAFAAALVVCLVSMYINYRSYQERHYLEWSYRNHGGEITIEFAPGWHAVHIYAMHPEDHDSHKLFFRPCPSRSPCSFSHWPAGRHSPWFPSENRGRIFSCC